MNNGDRAKWIAVRALAQIDDGDVNDMFVADRLSYHDEQTILAHIREFETKIRNTIFVTDEETGS